LAFDVSHSFQISLNRYGTQFMQSKIKKNSSQTQFWALSFFLIFVFMTGGASRSDVQSLTILWPIAIFACGFGLWTLKRVHFQERKWLFIVMGVSLGLTTLHLLPMPEGMQDMVPALQLARNIDQSVGYEGIWRPLAASPVNGWNALLSLLVPAAIVILGAQLTRNDVYRLLPLVIILGVLSGVLGVLQVIGNPESNLYFYRITNNGSAVGLFSNRNHAGIFLACLFPLLAVYASPAGGTPTDQIRRQLISSAIFMILIPLTLVTGSRSGFLSSLIGLVGAAILFRKPLTGQRKMRDRYKVPIVPAVGVALLALVAITYFFARAEAIERLFFEPQNTDLRQDFWAVSLNLAWQFFPFGSGSGSFAEIYRATEPFRLLDSTYLNRAHSDWIEIALTFGAFGVLIILGTSLTYFLRSWVIWRKMEGSRQSVAFSRMASITIMIIAFASLADYPLRTPAIMGLFAVFAIWFTEAGRGERQLTA
jgi:O-Antigen ligase